MRPFIILTLVSALTTIALAQFCPPDTCAHMKCSPELTETSCLARGPAGRYIFREHGGGCGCCPGCVKILHEGENCEQMMIMDAPPSEICGDGLKCTMDYKNLVCVKKTAI